MFHKRNKNWEKVKERWTTEIKERSQKMEKKAH